MTARLASLFLLLTLPGFAATASAQGNVPPKVDFTLDGAKAKPGQTVKGGVTVAFAEGLHGYQNPPSEDYMIPVAVKVAGPVELVDVSYPRGIEKQVGGADKPIRVYEGTIRIPVTLKAPSKPGSHEVTLEVSYQQCTEEACFAPAKETVSLKLEVVADAPKPKPADTKKPPLIPGTAKPKPADPQKTPAKPVDTKPTEPAKGTQEPAKSPDKRPAQDPKAAQTPEQSQAQPPQPDPDTPVASGVAEPRPGDPSQGTQEPAPKAAEPEPTQAQPQPDSSQEAPPAPSAATSTTTQADNGLVSRLIRDSFQSGNYAFLLVAAILTGLALTLTPCVYPMIPVTISFFSGQVAGSRKGRLGLGFVYMVGIAAMYGAIGGAAAALGGSIGSLFQNRWFLIGLAAVMIGLALSMFDVYEIGIPRFIGKHLRGRSGVAGALVMGLLVGIAAAPCAGPLVIAVATKVAEYKSVPLGLLVFSAIGLGIGLPFFALGAFASGAKALPKSGGWLKTVKSILGIVVLWIALDYLLKAFPQQFPVDGPSTLLVRALFLIGAAAYLILVENSGTSRVILGLKGAAILLCGLLAGQALQARAGGPVAQQIEWIPFTQAAFEEAKRSGKPIVVDASANWCVACHEIENAVFKKPEGVAAMRDVVALRIDHSTGVDPKYVEDTSRQFDIKGLPHIEFLKPGGQRARVIHGIGELGSPAQLKTYLREAGASL